MAGICNSSTPKSHATDVHRVTVVSLDGESISDEFDSEQFDAVDWNSPLPGDWTRFTAKQVFVRLGIKKQRLAGVAWSQLIGRVTNGEEATNVKAYSFIGPGAAIAKTNIGTAYVNVCPGANGERILVDFTGCTQFRPVVTANLVGAGPFGFRMIKDGDSTVLFENANVALTGERELDPGWQAIPPGFTGLEVLRLQAKSVTAADDPVVRRAVLLVK